jgi:hypothetical protein
MTGCDLHLDYCDHSPTPANAPQRSDGEFAQAQDLAVEGGTLRRGWMDHDPCHVGQDRRCLEERLAGLPLPAPAIDPLPGNLPGAKLELQALTLRADPGSS